MINKTGSNLKYYLELSKLKIMIPVSLTGFTGYFIFEPYISFKILFVTTGILFMAIAASVLNQIQEVDLDRKMNRTSDRPIPRGRIRLNHALVFFVLILSAGAALLYIAGNAKATIIGLMTLFWYNVIYTYSKRITAFAVFPGAVTGALIPLIGWTAAGGGVWEKTIIFIEFLFFTGQIPHFWLLILKYGEEYKNAGIPSLTSLFSEEQINRLTFTWVVSSVFAALFLCIFEIVQTRLMIGFLVTASLLIIWKFLDLLRKKVKKTEYQKYSIILDSYFLLILLILCIDRLII